jgi:hypothetical protein
MPLIGGIGGRPQFHREIGVCASKTIELSLDDVALAADAAPGKRQDSRPGGTSEHLDERSQRNEAAERGGHGNVHPGGPGIVRV